MRPWSRWLYIIAGLAAVIVTVSAVPQAIRQASWTPIVSVGWLPAVIAATWPGSYRRCRRRPRTPAG
jgi:hypothetical protein